MKEICRHHRLIRALIARIRALEAEVRELEDYLAGASEWGSRMMDYYYQLRDEVLELERSR